MVRQRIKFLKEPHRGDDADACVQSRRSWIGLPTRYDDDGSSGGNLARPGVPTSNDVEAGGRDTVATYKLDRSSRSLLDLRTSSPPCRSAVAHGSSTTRLRLDTPASPPVEIAAISKVFLSPTNPRKNDSRTW